MPVLPQQKELESLIESAMKEFAPSIHRELKRQVGALQTVLEQRAAMAREVYHDMISQARRRTSRVSAGLSPDQMISEMTHARSLAAHTAIALAVEFPDDTPDEEFGDWNSGPGGVL
jgi:hypothetical protein